MDCETFRRICDAEPGSRDSAYVEHAANCAACARYLDRARRIDDLIHRALRIQVPESGPARSEGRWGASRLRALAVAAASVALIVGVATGTWLAQSDNAGHTLAADVARHIAEEPQALAEGDHVGAVAVARTLALHDVRLAPDVGSVVYAETCVFRGRQIPHLVVRTEGGLVTVLILPEERPSRLIEIAASGMSGRIVPVLGRAVAVVGQSRVARSTEDRIVAAIGWEI
jgi:hypothetical protein